MPDMTISEAAKWTGKDRSTLFKAIKAGRISAKKDEDGQWWIDPAELERVYPPARNFTRERTGQIQQQALGGELAALQQVITLLERQLEDVRRDRDHWRTQAESQTRLLSHLSATPAEPARPHWWRRLTRKG
jgi:hypothetical protein